MPAAAGAGIQEDGGQDGTEDVDVGALHYTQPAERYHRREVPYGFRNENRHTVSQKITDQARSIGEFDELCLCFMVAISDIHTHN